MRVAGDGSPTAITHGKNAIRAAVDAGYTQFDHADIYGAGRCEELFGEVLRESPGLRDRLQITSKSGVRLADSPAGAPKRYDLSASYLTRSVEGSLRRLSIDRIDMFLLHRPDYLLQADEVARAFDTLQASGSVARFGVSNFSPSQVDLLQSVVDAPLGVHQMEINLHNVSRLQDGTLDQCQRLGMTPEAWCPLAVVAYPAWGNTFTGDDVQRIRAELDRQSEIYAVDDWIVVLAWLLKHPARIAPVIGSTTPARISAARKALEVDYSANDWYRLLQARNGEPVP